MSTVPKRISLKLLGLDGNAFALMGAFRKQARIEGWTDDEIAVVLVDAMSGDYSRLLYVLSSHCEPPHE
jgi:hypothetical protein